MIDLKYSIVKTKKCQVNFSRKYPLPSDDIIQYLKNKLSRASFMVELYEVEATGERFTRVFPISAIRGNSIYANREAERRQRAIEDIDLDSGCCLFITLTTPYDINDPIGSWNRVKAEIPIFNRRMRALGMVEMVRCVEANAGGGCHIHVLVKMDRPMPFMDGWDKKNHRPVLRLDDEELYKGIRKAWTIGFEDIQVVKDSKVGGYVLKELSKYSSYEESLEKVISGDYEKADVQRLLTHYYADMTHTRLFTVSKGLRKQVETSQEEVPEPPQEVIQEDSEKTGEIDLINNMSKSTSNSGKATEGAKRIGFVYCRSWPGGGGQVPKYGIHRPGDGVFEVFSEMVLEIVRPPGVDTYDEFTNMSYYSVLDV
jgi:hypothetical protein